MHPSSTSSSKALVVLLQLLAPPAAVAVACVLLFGAWGRWSPAPPEGLYMEEAVIGGQWRRSQTAGPVDLLLIGDSSCLLGVDAAGLQEALGLRTESLCTIGMAGPRSFLSLIERHVARFRNRPHIVIALHLQTLQVRTDTELFRELSGLALGPESRSFAESARTKAVSVALQVFGEGGMLGEAGRRYGSPSAFRAALDAGHGTFPDPTRPQFWVRDAELGPVEPRLSESMATELAALATGLQRLDLNEPLFLATPVPRAQLSKAAAEQRDRVWSEVTSIFGSEPDALLDTPPALPNASFTTPTHLTPAARLDYTKSLARALRAQLGEGHY